MGRLGRLGVILLALWLGACATPRRQGDRAFERQEYDQALAHYKEVIEGGTREWKVYFRAAKAASKGANFSLAERYYSRALRYGGGTEVARQFADFYLSTSNYSKAVRLLQFLLESDVDKQPIYNNLGTALMYGGSPLDAESYLMVAQQMDPKDPVPYVNLGVLYERYLHNPQLSVGFYGCYIELSKSRTQRRKVGRRIEELRAKYGRVSNRVECGEPFRMESEDPVDLEAKMKELEGGATVGGREGAPAPKESDDPIELRFSKSGESKESGESAESKEPTKTEESGESKESTEAKESKKSEKSREGPVIERGGTRPEGARRAAPAEKPDEGASEGNSTSKVLKKARAAWKKEEYSSVVEAVSTLSLDSMNVEAMRMYGLSYAELGENEKAAQWLGWVVERKPDKRSVGALIEVYSRLGRSDDRTSLCKKYRGRADYEEATSACPPVEVDESNAEKIEEIQKQMKKNR
jgi:hypothetical protein